MAQTQNTNACREPDKARRLDYIMVRCTTARKDAIKRAAQRVGKSMTDYVLDVSDNRQSVQLAHLLQCAQEAGDWLNAADSGSDPKERGEALIKALEPFKGVLK